MPDIKKAYEGLTPEQQSTFKGGLTDFETAVKSRQQKDPQNEDTAIGDVIGNIKLQNNVPTVPAITPTTTPTNGSEGQIKRPVLDLTGGGTAFYDKPEAPDYEQIRQKEIEKAQAMIDATRAVYEANIADIQRQGQRDLQETGSIAVGAGLAGSPFKRQLEDPVIRATEQQKQAERSRREAEIARIMGNADTKAEQRFLQEREFAANERDKYVNEQIANQNEFRNRLKEAASQGIGFDDMTPEQQRMAKERSGMDDFSLSVYLNSNKPKPEQKDISYMQVGNKVIGYYTDFDEQGNPTIKKFESEPLFEATEQNLEYNQTTTDSGQIILTPKNFDPNKPIKDQIVIYGDKGEFSKPQSEAGSDATSDMKEYALVREQGYDGDFLSFIRDKKSKNQEMVGGYTEDQNKLIISVNDKVSKNDTYKRTNSMRGYADNVITALGQGTGTGDIAAINQFQKVIDEGAVTRDQDVKLVQTAQSLLNRLKTNIDKLEGGEQLSEDLRAEMKETVSALYDAQVEALLKDPFIKSTENNVKRQGIELQDTILGELSTFDRRTSNAPLEIPTLKQSYRDLKSLLKAQPEFEDTIRQYSEQYPDDKDEEMLQFFESQQSFNQDLSMSKKGYKPTDPITGAKTNPDKVIAGYNFTSYATDPKWGKSVKNVLKKTEELKSIAAIDNYIKTNKPKSNITGNIIAKASSAYGVPMSLLLAIIQHESLLGTTNVALKNNNLSGITWNGRNGQRGTPRPSNEGGYYVKYPTIQDGVNALAQNIARRNQLA